MYIAQQCFGLSDEGIEDAIYDSMAIRNFVGIDLSIEEAPDATTLLKFRRLLETHQLTKRVFATINNLLNMQGLILKEGTVVDAHSGAVHTLETTPANTADVTKGHSLLHGQERMVFADAGYQGIEKRTEEVTNPNAVWHVSMRPGKRRALSNKGGDKVTRILERLKSSVRACVEHPFHIVKNLFGLKKVKYRGLAKNTAQLYTLFALANLLITKKRRDALHAQGASC